MILRLFMTVALFSTASAAEKPLVPFLRAYCLKCHGEQKQKGDRRFDHIAGPETYQEILDVLNLAEMPPEDEKQPSTKQLKQVVAWLTSTLRKAREAARENVGKVVLRRLNRSEYLNTTRDLFEFKMIDFDPTTTFPPDDSVDGFNNNGEGLVTSDHLLRNYLAAARKIADKAIRPGPRPERIHYRAEGQEISGHSRGLRPEIARMTIKDRQPLGLRTLDKRKIPADGEYLIRFKALAYNRKSRYKDEDLRYNSDEPMRLSISIDSRELGATAHRIIGEYEIPDEKIIEIEHRTWLDRGFTFHLHWANGPNGSFKRIMRKVLPKYTKDAIYPLRNPPEMYIGSGPELHVYSLEIEGPFYDQWPLPGFARYFPNPPRRPDAAYLDASLTRLAQRAFRRPVTNAGLEPYLKLARQHLTDTKDFWKAANYGVRSLLVSPSFLYNPESGTGSCNPHELASRLSYFLWSSMPDDELRTHADDGSLLRPPELQRQVTRMLGDPKAKSFVSNFTDQWLGLRKLGEMPPDPEKNPSYYADNLESAMKEETRRFFAHLLAGNGSLLDFIDSDYTFANDALARHYGIRGIDGTNFRKISLQPSQHRGGLLGHGSILTATSNGVETQPVLRGVWILENLLGTPPNPPPPDVDPIEPDTRGVSTIRELMEKHRNNPTCFECHRKMDPLGLAMENYDHIGAWRDRYTKKLRINAKGEMPDGTVFDGVEGIRNYLKARPDQFTHCLTEKMLTYALGRRLAFTDRDDLAQIVETVARQNYNLRELVQQIVASEVFRSK
tara:strand:+ start:3020 stop:5368 length:2349 start_codon:yes stop_codon:yes gene_type:complete